MQSENRFAYERALPGRTQRKNRLIRLLFVALCLFAGAILIFVCFFFGLAWLLFISLPILETILILLTRRFWSRQYEYSFFGETLTVSRIDGGSKRKCMAEIDLRKISAAFPFEESNRKKAEAFGARHSIYAIPDLAGENLYLILFGEGKERTLLCMELDERSLSIIRFYNRAALTK
ncbi:MAG: hypothetical protein IJR88_03005 [Clostridia bacterium]|nr:hypothetical protein [Clostridia bacterium]